MHKSRGAHHHVRWPQAFVLLYISGKGLPMSDFQTITDHARLDSVKRYTKTEVARKRELMEWKVIRLQDCGITLV